MKQLVWIFSVIVLATPYAVQAGYIENSQPKGAYKIDGSSSSEEAVENQMLGGETVSMTQEYQGIRYATGGIGDEELQELKAIQQEFNLRLLNTGKHGEFVGTYTLQLVDNTGREIFNGKGDGPLFYLSLPTGSYVVKIAMEENPEQVKKVILGKSARELRFYWNAKD
jgi:hypothetical protein